MKKLTHVIPKPLCKDKYTLRNLLNACKPIPGYSSSYSQKKNPSSSLSLSSMIPPFFSRSKKSAAHSLSLPHTFSSEAVILHRRSRSQGITKKGMGITYAILKARTPIPMAAGLLKSLFHLFRSLKTLEIRVSVC